MLQSFLFFIMSKKLWLGVALVFVAGMAYLRVVAVIIALCCGGVVLNEQGDFVTPPRGFYETAGVLVLYSIPFLVSGLYLIHKGK